MWRFFVAASCLLVACHALYPPRGGGAFSSVYSFPTGGMIDFTKFNSLEGICNAAVSTTGVTDHLSDVMRNAVQYKMNTGANLMTMGGMGRNSAKWNCLIGAATGGYSNPGNAANGVGDYFDTAAELRIQPFLPFKYNPCEMVFCGEQGMTPAAMAREVMMRLQSGMPLGNLASAFGSRASQLMRGGGRGGGMRPPMPNMMGGGGMMGRGMSPMMPPMNPMGGGMFGMSGMPNMPGMPSMPSMGNMGGMMQRMQNMMKMMGNGGGPSTGMAKKTPSTNALSTNPGADPTAASLDTNATGNTVTTKTDTKPAPASSSSSSSSSGASMSNSLPGGAGMMSNPFKAMGMPGGMPPMGGGGMGMPGMGMPGMGMPGMGMPGMGMPGMGMPGMGMPGMGMPGMGGSLMGGMPGMGMMGMPGMGGMGMGGMPGMGGMGGMGNMLSAMMTAEYLMDMPDPPAYGMRGNAFGGMGGAQMAMGGQMGGMGGMPPPPPPAPPMASSYRHRSARPPPPPPPPRHRHRPPMSSSMGRPAMRTAPNGMGALTDILNMMG